MNRFKKLPIKIQVLTVGLFVIAMFPITAGILYRQASSVIINQSTQNNTELVSLLKQRVSNNYSDITQLMISVGYDTTVQDFLSEQDGIETYKLSQKVESLFRVAKNTKNDILEIIIINKAGKYISINGNIKYAFGIDKSLGNDGNVHCVGFRKANNSIDSDTFIFGMNIFSSGRKYPLGEKIGSIAIVLDVKAINIEIGKLPRLSDTNIYFLDDKDTVFTSSNPSGLVLNKDIYTLFRKYNEKAVIDKIGNDSYVVQVHKLPEIKGKIVTAVPVRSLVKDLGKLKSTTFWLIVITLLFVSIPFTTVMMNILKPLQKLTSFMTSIKSGNLKTLKSRVHLEGYAEIEAISEEFNMMLEQIDSLTHRLVNTSTKLYQAELEKQQAEIAYLQSQINPHFLYNTLDSLKGMALAKGVKEIYEMSSALGAIFLYSVKGSEEVSLKEELRIVESYIKILQIRFSGRITFQQDCSDDVLDAIVPKMILQPIVENAVYHGLESLTEGGVLRVCSRKNAKNNLEISIADNGVGIKSSYLCNLNQLLKSDEPSTLMTGNEHIGLKNVNNRIKLKYGSEYGISLKSVEGEGTEVLLLLPLSTPTLGTVLNS